MSSAPSPSPSPSQGGAPRAELRRNAMMQRVYPVVEWSRDVRAADWIVGRLHPFAQDLGSFVPDGFAAYARILHPAWHSKHSRRFKVRWGELALERGVALRATTRFDELQSHTTPLDTEPLPGSLERDELAELVELLRASTASPGSCWFGIWDGYGWMQGSPAIAEAVSHRPGEPLPQQPQRKTLEPAAPPGPRVEIPERSLALYSGPIDAATAFCEPPASQSPNLWWPEDHAWCVASEIEFRSTYIGGPDVLIDRVLRDERLEALPAASSDHVTD